MKITKLLDIPEEVDGITPKITMIGFDEIDVENFLGILEYEDIVVKISTKIGNIVISGFYLKLNQMTDESINVSGKIEKIEFEKNNNVR